MATRAEIVSSYLAYFGRPPDFDGLKFYEGVPFADMISNFSKSPESQALYGTVFGAAQINAIYQNLFNRDAEPAGLDYWSGRVNSGALSPAAAALGIMQGAQNADKTSVDNKIAIINLFESKLDTAAEITGYAGSAAAASARAYIKTVDSTAASVTAATTGVDAAVVAAVAVGGTTGLSLVMTTGIDTLVGSSGNDTFTGDNASLSSADSISAGTGTDTVKIYGISVANAAALPAFSSVEKLYLNGALASVVVDASTISGLANVELDGQLGTAATVKVTTGQTVTLSNNTAASFTTTISGNTPTALGLTLTNIGNATGTVDTVDFSGTALATLNVTGATTGSKATLTNTGLLLKTVNVDGTAAVALTSGATGFSSGVTTVSAAAATGNVSYDASGWTTAAGFKFTGGAGNDTIKLIAGNLATLTAGTQLDGGAGTGDKLSTTDVTANFTAAVYAKINAATGFEVLGLAGAGATVVDASQLTSIKSFSIETDQVHTISAMATGSKVAITAAHTANITLGSAVGVSDVGLTINSATGTGFTVGGNLTVAQTAVSILSQGTNTAANVITALVNADNSVYTLTGSNALTISATASTTIGSKYDASAMTGKLTIVGNATAYASGSSKGDIIIGGTAGDAITASVNSSTLTGNGGADTFTVSPAVAGTSFDALTTITDFTKGDKIAFAAATTFTATKVDLSGAATLVAALDTLAAGNAADLKWGTFGGNTYLIDDVGAGATLAATDVVVKLTGTLDLSTSTLAANTLTFA